MQQLQLYIENQRVDLFNDEVVSITQSIKNVKDVSKIFTEFTKTFSVPASKKNNKIFKHYYNFDIVNGFDARTKKNATIELNTLPFKKGKIKLDGVTLKDNKPHTYKITFFGSTVDLKDLLGEDKLDVLSWLDNFQITYSSANVKAYLQNAYDKAVGGTTYNDAILTPLISTRTRWYFDSTTGHAHDELAGNLHYDSGVGHQHGALWSDMKYSIRVHLILLAIQERYGLEFSTDFFNTSNAVWHNLYMFMHRKKGDVQSSATGIQKYQTNVGQEIDSITGDDTDVIYDTSFFVERTIPFSDIELTIQLTPNASYSTVPYDVIIYKDGSVWETYANEVGGGFIQTYVEDGEYVIYVQSTQAFLFDSIDTSWETQYGGSSIRTINYDATSVSILVAFTFRPTQQLPEMKVIDFLTSIFKTFNLTAYQQDNGIIKVQKLDDFYATYNTYDISQYVDVSTSDVNMALPYKEINFDFEGNKTFFASIFNQLNNKYYGQLKYKGVEDKNWNGDIYNVKVPFEKVLYERLYNLFDNTLTTAQWGWMADDNQEAYKDKPLIHYVHRVTSGTQISFRDSTTAHSPITTYYVPLNANGITGSDQTLNFNAEIDEYALIQNNQTLFSNFYVNYIKDVFNIKKRLTKIKANLPLKILLNFTLSDRFDINGQRYKINAITTNLQTGESDIELLNELL